MGRIDINQCGTSDPGTTATLTPFCETEGLYFNAENEPEDFKYEFDKYLLCTDDLQSVSPNMDSLNNYYDYVETTEDINSKFKMYHKKKEGPLNINIKISDDDRW